MAPTRSPSHVVRSYIPGLDGLRGIAASIVLVTHMSNWGYELLPGLDLRGIGRSGVVLFFVLSAFLLASQILTWSESKLLSANGWLSYLEARVLRIWPLFIVVLAFSLLTTHLSTLPLLWQAEPLLYNLPVPMTADALLAHILLRQGEDILWTIPVEFKFYLILPWIMVSLMLTLRRRLRLITALILAGIGISYWLTPSIKGGPETVPFLGVFLTGVLLAFLLPPPAREATRLWSYLRRVGLGLPGGLRSADPSHVCHPHRQCYAHH